MFYIFARKKRRMNGILGKSLLIVLDCQVLTRKDTYPMVFKGKKNIKKKLVLHFHLTRQFTTLNFPPDP